MYQYASDTGGASRSAVVHQAIGLLREVALEHAYAAAWDEWASNPDAGPWDATAADGIAAEKTRACAVRPASQPSTPEE